MRSSREESGSTAGGPRQSARQIAKQTPDQIVRVFEAFLAECPRTAVVEEGSVLFDMTRARYSIAESHGRCTLHLWDEERNIVRTVSAAVMRASGLLRISGMVWAPMPLPASRTVLPAGNAVS